jgi:transposase
MRKAGRLRRKGGGRKQATTKDETLRADLEELLEPKGEQPRLVQWTTKSMSKLKEALKSQGHAIGETAIRELLKGMGFSLKANKKAIEGQRMPTEMPNFSRSIVQEKSLKQQASR